MNDTFAAALQAAGWTLDDYDAHVAELVATAPPLPDRVVQLLRTPRPPATQGADDAST